METVDEILKAIKDGAFRVTAYTESAGVWWKCQDCGKPNFEMFWLKDAVWLKIMPNFNGLLCLDCCEKRLGRKVTNADMMQPAGEMVALTSGHGG